jgi:hypothetical protein
MYFVAPCCRCFFVFRNLAEVFFVGIIFDDAYFAQVPNLHELAFTLRVLICTADGTTHAGSSYS